MSTKKLAPFKTFQSFKTFKRFELLERLERTGYLLREQSEGRGG